MVCSLNAQQFTKSVLLFIQYFWLVPPLRYFFVLLVLANSTPKGYGTVKKHIALTNCVSYLKDLLIFPM